MKEVDERRTGDGTMEELSKRLNEAVEACMPQQTVFGDIDGDPEYPFEDQYGKGMDYWKLVASHIRSVRGSFEALNSDELGLLLNAEVDDSMLTYIDHDSAVKVRDRQKSTMTGLVEDITDTMEGESTCEKESFKVLTNMAQLISLYSDKNTSDLNPLRPWAGGPAAIEAQALFDTFCNMYARFLESIDGANYIRDPEMLFFQLLLKNLKKVLAAPAEHSRADSKNLEPYNGPDRWSRLLSATQLIWTILQLNQKICCDIPPSMIFPLLSDVICSDPYPCVQACAFWGLKHMFECSKGNQQIMLWIKAGAKDILKRGTTACDKKVWPSAAAASSALASAAQKFDILLVHDVFKLLLQEGERRSDKASQVLVWLKDVPPLFRLLGLQLCRYFYNMMPLIMEWILGPRGDVRLEALKSLREVIHVVWPRIPTHARVIWLVLEKAYEKEKKLPGKLSEATIVEIDACANDLWLCCGQDFKTFVTKRIEDDSLSYEARHLANTIRKGKS